MATPLFTQHYLIYSKTTLERDTSGNNRAKSSEPPQIGGPTIAQRHWSRLFPSASTNQFGRPTTGPTPLEPTVSFELREKTNISTKLEKTKTYRISIKVSTCKRYIALGHPISQLHPLPFLKCCFSAAKSIYNRYTRRCLITIHYTSTVIS